MIQSKHIDSLNKKEKKEQIKKKTEKEKSTSLSYKELELFVCQPLVYALFSKNFIAPENKNN